MAFKSKYDLEGFIKEISFDDLNLWHRLGYLVRAMDREPRCESGRYHQEHYIHEFQKWHPMDYHEVLLLIVLYRKYTPHAHQS